MGDKSESLNSLIGIKCSGFDIKTFNFAIFYSFSQRVSRGDASKEEIAFMSKIYDLVDKRNDWNVAIS